MSTTIAGQDVLTHSSMSCFKTCRRKYQYAYVIGMRPDRQSTPLRLGGAVHAAIEALENGTVEDACKSVYESYAAKPSYIDEYDWAVEREIVLRLICGYAAYWQNDGSRVIANEIKVSLPILNPDTGRSSRTYEFEGKVDKIIERTARLAVREHKTTGDSLDSDSDYWARLRMDTQITGYMLGAQEAGHAVETVEYDVIRKPRQRPRKLTKAEVKGIQTSGEYCGEPFTAEADIERESIEMYGARLAKEIREDPGSWFQRKEIPRLNADLEEFRSELWLIARDVREAHNNKLWYRNTAACLKPYKCEYFKPCQNGDGLDGFIPDGFVVVENVHQELCEEE